MAPDFVPGLRLAREQHLREAITDPEVGRLPMTGAIDQFIDSTDAEGDLGFLHACGGYFQ